MVLVTPKEILARIPLANILYDIVFDEPISLHYAMKKYSEIAYLNSRSSIVTYCYKFRMIRDYCVDNNFLVYRKCITCDHMPELDVSTLHTCMRPIMQSMSSTYTYWVDGHGSNIRLNDCPTASSFVCDTYQSSAVEAWYNSFVLSHHLD